MAIRNLSTYSLTHKEPLYTPIRLRKEVYMKNYEKMWMKLKERLPEITDDDDMIISADMEEIIEELENEWEKLI